MISVQPLLALVFIVLNASVILVLIVVIFSFTIFAISVKVVKKLFLTAFIALVTAVLVTIGTTVMIILSRSLTHGCELKNAVVQVFAMVFMITPIAVVTTE